MRVKLFVGGVVAACLFVFVASASAQVPQRAVAVPASFFVALDGDLVYTAGNRSVAVTSLSTGQTSAIYRIPRKAFVSDLQASGGAVGIALVQVGRRSIVTKVIRRSAAGAISTVATSRAPDGKLKKGQCASDSTLGEVHQGTVLAITLKACNSAAVARTTIRAASDAGIRTVFAGNERSFALSRIGGIGLDASLRGTRLFLGGMGAGVWDLQTLQFTLLETSRRNANLVAVSDAGDAVVDSVSLRALASTALYGGASNYTDRRPLAKGGTAAISKFCGDVVLRGSAKIGRKSIASSFTLFANPFAPPAIPNSDKLVVPGQEVFAADCDKDRVALLAVKGRSYEIHTAPVVG